ncbi:hypothetical protein CH337_03895 [Rhodoblastus acidophilus]|nr:hypothetical protein CKO16_14620 [Rhodoblastus acidophilus]RAI23173.1 hypothetical protein CH337_03895 [Rhodoblastus acidophilus]
MRRRRKWLNEDGAGVKRGREKAEVKTYAPNTSNELEYAAAIQVGGKAGADADQARWSFLLTIFFRAVALLWMLEGLDQWRRILSPAAGSFLDGSGAVAVAVVFFAVMDLVAAVGLWMVAPWGGVVWLLTLMAQIYVAAIKPSFFPGGGLIKGFDGVLVAIYLFLSWRANRANGEISALDRLIDMGLVWAHRQIKGKSPVR